MFNILAYLMAIDWLADELHYNYIGSDFYSMHLLADRVRDFGAASDDVKEVYFRGFVGDVPPNGPRIASAASELFTAYSVDGLLGGLYGAFDGLIHAVEEVKKDSSLPSGIHAVLDDISVKALRYRFLVESTKDGSDAGTRQ